MAAIGTVDAAGQVRPDEPVIDLLTQWLPPQLPLEVAFPRALFRDEASATAWPHLGVLAPAFGAGRISGVREQRAALADVVAEMDRWNIRAANVPGVPSNLAHEVLDDVAATDGRVLLSIRMDPHRGMAAIRELERAAAHPCVKTVAITPSLCYPPVPPNSKEYYPIYAKCVELALPVFLNVGFPGPRVPSAVQDPIHLDELCWFFPELVVVMKHGGHPWVDTCFALLEKWPNLYYATSAMAPHRYPPRILGLLSSKSKGHKVLFAGYAPIIGYDQTFRELDALGLGAAERRAFLHDNAAALLGLDKPGRTDGHWTAADET